jgi:hypothetical protein
MEDGAPLLELRRRASVSVQPQADVAGVGSQAVASTEMVFAAVG